MLVDVIEFRHVLPCVAGAITHDKGRSGRVASLVTGKHRDLAAANGRYDAAIINRRDLRVAGAQKALMAHIADLSIAEGRHCSHLLPHSRQRQRHLLGKNLEIDNPGGVEVQGDSGPNP